MTVIAVTLPLSLAYAGLTALALAMKRHHEAAIGAKPPATRLRAFRVAGWVLMALMVASCLRLWPTGLALSMALGLVTLAGLPLVAWWSLHRFRLPSWPAPAHPAIDAVPRRRRGGQQARRRRSMTIGSRSRSPARAA